MKRRGIHRLIWQGAGGQHADRGGDYVVSRKNDPKKRFCCAYGVKTNAFSKKDLLKKRHILRKKPQGGLQRATKKIFIQIVIAILIG